MASGNQGNQGNGKFILNFFKCAGARPPPPPPKAADEDDITSDPITVATADSASAASSANAAKAIASAAAAASAANPASAAAVAATAAAAEAASTAATVAAAAAALTANIPNLVVNSNNASEALAADPGNQKLENLAKAAQDALTKALYCTNSYANAAQSAATEAAAALASANISAQPNLGPGDAYISCTGLVQCRGKVGPAACNVVKCLVGVVVLGAVAFLFMKIVADGKFMFGKGGK